MIIYELTGTEGHPVYKALEAANGDRQLGFLNSIVAASLDMRRPFLYQQVIKAFNFHAIACLHINAGEYRPWNVEVGDHKPPAFFRVSALMDDFVNDVNRHWEDRDPIESATFVLWRLNHIHPFINGNGRTARAAAYFVLCLKANGLIRGTTLLPELLKRDKVEMCEHLQHAHDTFHATADPDLKPLHDMVQRLVMEQVSTVVTVQPLPQASTTAATGS